MFWTSTFCLSFVTICSTVCGALVCHVDGEVQQARSRDYSAQHYTGVKKGINFRVYTTWGDLCTQDVARWYPTNCVWYSNRDSWKNYSTVVPLFLDVSFTSLYFQRYWHRVQRSTPHSCTRGTMVTCSWHIRATLQTKQYIFQQRQITTGC